MSCASWPSFHLGCTENTIHVQWYTGLSAWMSQILMPECGSCSPASVHICNVPEISIIHIDTIYHTMHLIPIYGTQFIPGEPQIQPHHSYDVFQAFYINKFADHHAFEIASWCIHCRCPLLIPPLSESSRRWFMFTITLTWWLSHGPDCVTYTCLTILYDSLTDANCFEHLFYLTDLWESKAAVMSCAYHTG